MLESLECPCRSICWGESFSRVLCGFYSITLPWLPRLLQLPHIQAAASVVAGAEWKCCAGNWELFGTCCGWELLQGQELGPVWSCPCALAAVRPSHCLGFQKAAGKASSGAQNGDFWTAAHLCTRPAPHRKARLWARPDRFLGQELRNVCWAL